MFVNLIAAKKLFGCTYVEPFAGGAGLALKLLRDGFVGKIILNDSDEAIWSFWYSVIHFNRELCERVACADISISEWHRQRAIWAKRDIKDPLSLGYATFFLNRTNRSGIIDGAGPIGGYNQLGPWKLDARFNRERLSQNISELASFSNNISLHCMDASDFLKKMIKKRNTLFYLDPPYYVKGRKLYKNWYQHNDHEEIATLVSEYRMHNIVVSYDAVEQILNLYSSFEPHFYELEYSAGTRTSGKEVIFLSDSLNIVDMSALHCVRSK